MRKPKTRLQCKKISKTNNILFQCVQTQYPHSFIKPLSGIITSYDELVINISVRYIANDELVIADPRIQKLRQYRTRSSGYSN